MYVPGAITPLILRSLYFARNSGPPDMYEYVDSLVAVVIPYNDSITDLIIHYGIEKLATNATPSYTGSYL